MLVSEKSGSNGCKKDDLMHQYPYPTQKSPEPYSSAYLEGCYASDEVLELEQSSGQSQSEVMTLRRRSRNAHPNNTNE
jgi:hypothetical protein